MNTIDLHVHSNASDGTLTPSEVVCLAKKNNLSAIALTDHDTVDGISEAIEQGKKSGVEIIPGIELSSSYAAREIHIVGLFVDYRNEEFLYELKKLNEVRNRRNEQMAEKFCQMGINISINELMAEYPDAIITRAHFASYLHKKGYVSSVKDAFDRYLNDHGPCFVPRYKMPSEDTIKLIHKVGGLAILAHPILYKLGADALKELVRYLTQNGLDGIEAMYSTYTPGDEVCIRKLAKENGLLLSGGSDFHGDNKPFIKLGTGKGTLNIPYGILQELKNN